MEENGLRELEELIERIKKQEEKPSAQELMGRMDKLRFYVPVMVDDKNVLKALNDEIKTTGKAKLPSGAGTRLLLINNDKKEQFVGIYTASSQIPGNMKNNCVIQMPFADVLKFAGDPAHKCVGVVVNPFTQNFMLKVQMNAPGQSGQPVQLTPEQIHDLARRNVEYVLMPRGVYQEGKDYFDHINADFIYGMYNGQYSGKLPCPIKREQVEVMSLGISENLDLTDIVLPAAPGSSKVARHILITWDKAKDRAGYYVIADKFLFVAEDGKVTELSGMPAEGTEMTAVLELEEKRE